MDNKVGEKRYYKSVCRYCNQLFFKVKRHEECCSKNEAVAQAQYLCSYCAKLYNRIDNLKVHMKKCSQSETFLRKRASLPCKYVECNSVFNTLSSLIDHLHECHKAPVAHPQTITFENESCFIDWKKKEQARTFCNFFKNCGDRLSSQGLTKYFYCQLHGSEKAHRKVGLEERKTDRRIKRGRTKTGNICISSMKATYLEDGSVTVLYQPTHSHPPVLSIENASTLFETIESTSEQPFLSECIIETSVDENKKEKGDEYRDVCKKRLWENANKILVLVENGNISDDILSKLDYEVDAALKCCDALLE